MGCVCSKGSKGSEKDFNLENHAKGKQLKANKSSRLLGSSLRREETAVNGDGGANEVMTRLISDDPREDNLGSTPPSDYAEKNVITIEKPAKPQLQRHSTMQSTSSGELVRPKVSRIATISNGERGAQVVAGWPSWLTSVAGEAINGWVPRRADSFEKLEKIGQGTYSSVYKARDLDTNKMVALKKVRFANMDPESVRFMAREILILRRLDHPNVMKLEGLITSRVSGSLYLIFEYMEHDLAGLIAMPGFKFTESQIKCYMQQLLRGLEHCHNQGVLHRDIKGSNLLINNDGNLKIGDFGLATFFHSPQKQPLTSRVVTLWYRPPELLLGATDYGVSVDLWSTGCILAELLAGKPIMPGRTEVEQLHKIFKLCGSPSEEYWKKSKLPHATIFKPQHPYRRVVSETFSNFSSSALALLDVLLAIEPEDRGTASFALQNEYFTTRPLPSDPSTLPKYPPSKELDAKLREEEARRQKAAVGVIRDRDPNRKSTKESRAVPAPDANAELQASINKRQGHSNPKSMSEKFAPEEDGGSGFPIEPPRGAAINVFSHSGQLMHPSAFGSSQNTNVNEGSSLRDVGSIQAAEVELRSQRSYMHRGSSQLSRFSNSVAIRGNSQFDSVRESAGNPHWPEERFSSRYNHLNGGEISENHDWARHLLDKPKLLHKKDEQQSGKEPAMGHLLKKNRIHFSGPLMPADGNLDEMLREHEKQIQHSVRKARLDKAKTKKTSIDNGQAQSLLLHHR